MFRTFLRNHLAAFYPCQEASNVARVNVFNPGVDNLADVVPNVAQVAGPNSGIPHAAFIDGSAGSLLAAPAVTSLFLGQSFAVSMVAQWINAALPGVGCMMATAQYPTPGFFSLGPDNTATPVSNPGMELSSLRVHKGITYFADSLPWFDGNWHQYSFSYDGQNIVCALDDYPDSLTLPFPQLIQPGADFNIGSNGRPNSQFNGNVCNVGVWNRPLTRADRIDLFNGGAFLPWPIS